MAIFDFVENFFFISLAITFALVLLLIYHFKQRIALVERKGDTMFELLANVVKELKCVKNLNVYYESLFSNSQNSNNYEKAPCPSKTTPETLDIDTCLYSPPQYKVIDLSRESSRISADLIPVSDDDDSEEEYESDEDESESDGSITEYEDSDDDDEDEEPVVRPSIVFKTEPVEIETLEVEHALPEEVDLLPEEVDLLPEEVDLLPEEVDLLPEEVKKKQVFGEIEVSTLTLSLPEEIVEEPTAPSVEPTAPSVEPTAPAVEPTAPSVEPHTPSVKPSAPSSLIDLEQKRDVYRKMNITQLRTLATASNVSTDVSKMKKGELIKLLETLE